jgi:hypothetical protein
MKKLVFMFLAVVVSISAFAQEKIKYGNIPYGISIEQAIERYSSIYDTYREETGGEPFYCVFIDFTALRPMFQNIFGNITTFSSGYTSAWTPFDKNFTRILNLGERMTRQNGSTYIEYTTLYFSIINGQTKLFMVARRGGVEIVGNTALTYTNNKSAVTELLGVNSRELSGQYHYYSSGRRSSNASVCVWEKNNERIILRVSNEFIENVGGFMYVSIPLWNEYEKLYIAERNRKENEAKNSAVEINLSSAGVMSLASAIF